MALEELRRRLYRKDAKLAAREKTVYNPLRSRVTREDILREESQWQKQERDATLVRSLRKPLLWIAIFFAVLVLVAFAVRTIMDIRANLFADERLRVHIEGPTAVRSGMDATYAITVDNDNATRLRDVVVRVQYTPSFMVTPTDAVRVEGTQAVFAIGTMAPREKKVVHVQGRFADVGSDILYIAATVRAVPVSRGAPVERTQRIGLRADMPLVLTVDAQRDVASGTIVEYIVRYSNEGDASSENLTLVADLPDGFVMHEAVPAATEDGAPRWMIGVLAPRTEGVVRIRGTISGERDDVKPAAFRLMRGDREVARAEWIVRIAPLPLVVTQSVNNATQSYVARAGEALRYTITYRNTSDVGMRDAVVRVAFTDRVVDFAKLRTGGKGQVLPTERAIVFRAADDPRLALLAPGDSGTITFSVPVRTDLPVRSDRDKDFTIVTVATIDSPDVPTPIHGNKTVSSNTLRVKVASPVQFTVEGFYDDYAIKNTGPAPPVRSIKTTYTIRLSVTNASSVLRNARVEAFLPTHVKWEGVTLPESEMIQFNPRTHKVVWELGEVKNGVGFFRKKREVRFQISVTPTADQVGRYITLINAPVFTAHDTFADVPVRIVGPRKTTALAEDLRAGDGRVRDL